MIEVPVPRPRHNDQLFEPSFMAVRKHIDNLIHPPGQDHQKESPVLRLVARDPDVV
jgi:NitT/TauT family transport system ATP-binding protein